jgi:hypothetical protein
LLSSTLARTRSRKNPDNKMTGLVEKRTKAIFQATT